jgi:APA family basic amino acid/polyamine antiporter
MRRLFPSGAGQRLRVGGAVPPPRKGAAMDGLFERRKPVEAIIADSRAAGEGDAHQLKRAMGVWGITALGIGAIVGTGIFVLTGHAAATSAGPGIVISFVIAGIVSALAALCYAELASTVPVSGSAYTYVYATLGEFIAWIVGWGLILEYALGAATVAIGWSGYFGDFLHATFGLTIPRAYSTNPFEGGVANVPAAVIILLISFLLIRGTQESNTVNKVIVCVKLAVVAFFIFIGIGHVNPANWHPFAPFGIKGIVNGAGLVFFAYIGFDAVSTSTIGLGWAGAIVAVGAIAGLTTVLLVMLYGQSRVFFAMSRDGLLPAVFSKVHPTFRTPYLSSALIGIVVAVVAAVAELDVVADLVNIGTLAAFALVSIGVVVLRRRSPDLKRGFRVPFSPVVPIVSAVAAVALIFNGLPLRTIEAYVIWLVIGLGVYFGYSRRNSKLHA